MEVQAGIDREKILKIIKLNFIPFMAVINF